MSKLFRAFALILMAPFALVSLSTTATAAEDAYRLKPGDTLEVSVWREEVLDRELIVLPDGSITFPLAGRVEVEGLSTPEVEKLISDALAEFLAEPVVTVSVLETGGNRVFLVGKIANPGVVVLNAPTTIAQVLSLIGAFDRFADEDEIKILRGVGKDAQYIHFDYDDLIDGENPEMASMLLEAGDVIIVP